MMMTIRYELSIFPVRMKITAMPQSSFLSFFFSKGWKYYCQRLSLTVVWHPSTDAGWACQAAGRDGVIGQLSTFCPSRGQLANYPIISDNYPHLGRTMRCSPRNKSVMTDCICLTSSWIMEIQREIVNYLCYFVTMQSSVEYKLRLKVINNDSHSCMCQYVYCQAHVERKSEWAT